MSVTLNTQLGSLMFTSQIPDIDLTTSDDSEAVVMIVSGGTSIFSATHIPFAKSITVHDIRSVIEYFMCPGRRSSCITTSRPSPRRASACVSWPEEPRVLQTDRPAGPAEALSRPAVYGTSDRDTFQRLDGCLSRLPLHPAHHAGQALRCAMTIRKGYPQMTIGKDEDCFRFKW